MLYNNLNSLRGLKNSDVYSFYSEVNNVAIENLDEQTFSLFTNLISDGLERFQTTTSVMSTVEQTQKINDLFNQGCNMWKGIRDVSKGLMLSPNLKVQETATKVFNIINLYGDITNARQDTKVGVFKSVANDINSLGDEAIDLLKIRDYIEIMDKSYTEVSQLILLRDKYRAENKAIVRNARKQIEYTYSGLINFVNGLIAVNGEDQYLDFINHFNEVITKHSFLSKKQTEAEQAVEVC
ncbi:MAG: DUF6261 family protein [Bacteroidales bacterium]|nr:DUF6261 family protein [Bacteroidales bacterium]